MSLEIASNIACVPACFDNCIGAYKRVDFLFMSLTIFISHVHPDVNHIRSISYMHLYGHVAKTKTSTDAIGIGIGIYV